MTNAARGETEITLGGYTFKACASMGALARVEGALGKALPDVLADVSEGSYLACLTILQQCALDPKDAEVLQNTVAAPDELAEATIAVFRASGLIDTGEGKDGGKPKARA